MKNKKIGLGGASLKTNFFVSLDFRKKQALDKGFEIKLPQFEGPFDLLLFFIERDELDIHDIPISDITNKFLGYIRQMQELNMDIASEFILVASTLMRIKAKMLLPRPEIDEQGQEIDPRKDLVDQLLEYKRYKEGAEKLKVLEELRMQREARGNIPRELAIIAQNSGHADELNNLTLFKLLETYQKVIERFNRETSKPKHTVIQYPYTIQGQKQFILGSIGEGKDKKLGFTDVLKECRDRYHVIFTFMAILELLQERILQITIGLGFNNFWLSRNDELEAVS
jgi:segregation and condensation protein A